MSELNEKERANSIASATRRYLFVRGAQAGMPQQAIVATHMNVVPPLGLVLPKPAHLALYVPGLHLLVVLESLPSPPLLVLLIFRRLIALAADSGMPSSIYRPSTPTLLIPGKIRVPML